MKARKDVVEGRAVTMFPKDWAIVIKESERDDSGVSAALRRIVREWNHDRRQRARQLVDTPVECRVEESG